MRNILIYCQSAFCSWGADMSWFCSVCEKSFSRKGNKQRHVMSKHRTAGLTLFQTVPMFSQKCRQVSLRASFHLHDCRNDRVQKNGLGSISIATSFRDNLPFPGEDRLVLFTMAACVYSYFEKGCRKNVHATIPKGNMRYFCCFPLALANTFSRPFVPIL